MPKSYPSWFLSLRKFALNVFAKYSLPQWIVFLMDISAVFLTFLFSYLLRFNLDVHAIPFPVTWYHAFIALVVFSIISIVFRSYSGLIRHTTLTDILLIAIVTTDRKSVV